MLTRFGARPAVFAALFAPAIAGAQCEPAWDTTAGNPGIVDGYVQPFAGWKDGGGEAIYVGGSFAGVGGIATKFIARWDPVANTWSKLGTGLNPGNTNGFVTDIVPFNPGGGEELIVGGYWLSAGGAPDSSCLAKWNGTAWSNCGAGLVKNNPDAVWALIVQNTRAGDRLIAAGSFPKIGGVQAGGIGSWDGKAWSAIGTGAGIYGSFSPGAFQLGLYDDGGGEDLYVGGRFDGVDGVASPILAKFDGGAWAQVGNGLVPNSVFAQITGMAVFDDGDGPALYVGGGDFHPSGQPSSSVAKWDGKAWTSIGQNLGGVVWDLAVFDDGNGPRLYCGGTAQPGIKYISRLENGQWVTVGGGLDNSVFGMRVVKGSLYVGGNFKTVDSRGASGIAARVPCGSACYADCDGSGELDVDDFICFQTLFGLGDLGADCDDSGELDIDDFICYQTAFGLGCE